MKISLITAVYNSESTISTAIKSVLAQTYKNIEYIVVDGASTDGTLKEISRFEKHIDLIISEPDSGLYNAINKGIRKASGNIIGILNSDDVFFNEKVIEKVAKAFQEEHIDVVYGDIQFVRSVEDKQIVRYYSSKKFKASRFQYGFMPAHPSFYTKRKLFEEIGYYKEDYIIASDFELLIRFLYNNKLITKYLEMPFVTMRTGGISNKSLKNRVLLNQEIIRACRENGINTNILKVYSKYFSKIFEFQWR
ncbi:MAG: glycosyltransferase [Bacteroidales bacterium]|nr:glycosyltransferase [Bacteroidales bacterium]